MFHSGLNKKKVSHTNTSEVCCTAKLRIYQSQLLFLGHPIESCQGNTDPIIRTVLGAANIGLEVGQYEESFL